MSAPITILLVEDNPADAHLTIKMMRGASVKNIIHVAEDGVDGLAFLRKEGAFADRPTPDLILLDLNLPRLNGCGFLEELRSDPEISTIPVIVLTSSAAEDDVRSAYALHANAYVLKPRDLAGYRQITKAIESFWLRLVHFPTKLTASS